MKGDVKMYGPLGNVYSDAMKTILHLCAKEAIHDLKFILEMPNLSLEITQKMQEIIKREELSRGQTLLVMAAFFEVLICKDWGEVLDLLVREKEGEDIEAEVLELLEEALEGGEEE